MVTTDHTTLPVTAADLPMDADTGSFEDHGTHDMARGWGSDVFAATSPSTLKRVDIDLLEAASPAPVTFGSPAPGMPWQDAIGAVATHILDRVANAPVTAESALNTAATTTATALAPPQVLASGTWLINPQVTLKTSLGNIVVDLYPNNAPVTVANCLAYVGSGFYDNLLFHRVIPDFVVQGGGFTTGQVYQTPPYAPIVLESNNGLQNDRGTLAMARTDAPNSATSQFFINTVDNNLGDRVNLNYISASQPGYAVFGKVLTGLSVVDKIAAVPTLNDVPTTDVKILEADQTRQGTLHSTSGRVDLGILAADAVPVWTGAPPTAWEYSLNAGTSWAQAPGRGFTVPQGAYETGSIQVRYIGPQGTVGMTSGPGGNMIVDTRAIKAGDGGANTLTGTSAVDVMYGLGGNDTLDGGSGSDSMVGGTGNDTYVVQSASDTTVELAGGGTDVVNASVSFTLAGNVERLTLTGSTAINGTGNSMSNTITGNTGANLLAGGSGNDTLNGGAGNDSLDGGTGNDSLVGSTGNDIYTVDSATDIISETTTTVTEIDSVTSSVTWTLGSYLEKLALTGSTAINGTGNTLANTITGNTGANLLAGSSGNDTLNGGAGNDSLDGGTGNDSLTGSTGLDTFRFSSALNGSSNVDTVSGFVAADDSVQLENGVFVKLTATGALNPSFFHASTTGAAADSNDYINYETDTGKLFYDADGNGAGAAVLFATLTGAPTLTGADIFVT